MSLPARERGLKLTLGGKGGFDNLVAPRTGAWIETCNVIACVYEYKVAPRTGAWIETYTLPR